MRTRRVWARVRARVRVRAHRHAGHALLPVVGREVFQAMASHGDDHVATNEGRGDRTLHIFPVLSAEARERHSAPGRAADLGGGRRLVRPACGVEHDGLGKAHLPQICRGETPREGKEPRLILSWRRLLWPRR